MFLKDEIAGKKRLIGSISVENDKVSREKADNDVKILEIEKENAKLRDRVEACSKNLESLSNLGSSAKRLAPQAVTYIEISVQGKEKAFQWETSATVTDNVKRLVSSYLENSDYHHTRARKLSARKVLEKIDELTKGESAIEDPIKRDIELVNFLRKEKDTFSVFGFNRKESQLHAIYRQAEVQLKSRITQFIGEISIQDALKERDKNKKRTKELEVLKKENIKYSEQVQQSDQVQSERDISIAKLSSENVEGSDKISELSVQYELTKKDLLAQNAKLFKMTSEELKVMTSSEVQLTRLDEQIPQIRRTLLENEKALAERKEQLKLLELDNEQLGTMARIQYLKVSQLARQLNREKEFSKVPDLESASPVTLMASANSFLKTLARELNVALPHQEFAVKLSQEQTPPDFSAK